MTCRLIGVLFASVLVAQCATRGFDTERAAAARAEGAATDAAVPIPEGVYRLNEPGVTTPILVRPVHAPYTLEAFSAKVQGIVILRAIVDRNGTVTDVRILKSLEASLDVAASEALAQWQFTPGTRDGEPVAVALVVEMTFSRP
jgi:periplasmic protein TonB